ncbi:DNA repair protein RecO [Ningiella sp. W23]|uniref:DNA repair protein RecO n=1 Tax=Ningiella sp. W23 TaxID=3023715 RepID=UPI0037579546
MSRLQATGFVIHRRAYRETSVIVDFFTRQYGRIAVVAKGARGAGKSDRKSLLQPLQLLMFEISGRSQLKNLGLLEAVQSPIRLQGLGTYSAMYLNELLMRAIPETEPMSILFEQYQQSLLQLAELDVDSPTEHVEVVLRNFEFVLLQDLGYLPDFTTCADNAEEIAPQQSYCFIAEQGFVRCPPTQRYALSGKDILDIEQRHYTQSARKVAKYICRQALLPIIGDKPLKSRELFVSQ